MYVYVCVCIYIHSDFMCIYVCLYILCMHVYMHTHIHIKHTYFKFKKLTSKEDRSSWEKYILKLFGYPINAISEQ